MTQLDELMSILIDFSPEQLNRFINDPVTVAMMRPDEIFDDMKELREARVQHE